MRVCRFCTQCIFESGKTWDFHHGNSDGLSASAVSRNSEAQGCVFCSRLFADLHGIVEAFNRPLYRWSIRKPGRTRESQDFIVIVFRPIHAVRGLAGGDIDIWLPERAFYLFAEGSLGDLVREEDLGESTNSDPAWSRVTAWIDNCAKHHPTCNHRQSYLDFVPTRLLDLSTRRNGFVRLIETKGMSITGPYCTLSHCWGNVKENQFINLTAANIKQFLNEGISLEQISNRNFTEALEVCERLSVRYLWIDSLCIVQHSEKNKSANAKEQELEETDWHHEAPLMDQVYRHSHCNIAATASRDRNGGLFRARNLDHLRGDGELSLARYHTSRKLGIFGDTVWRIVPSDYWERELLDNVLYTRAWVFQERMLAPRILHFSKNQIFWDCGTLSACEVLPSGLPQPIDTISGTDRHWRQRLQDPSLPQQGPLAGEATDSLEQFWKRAVQSYTKCNLTNGGDKLVAIWGVAKLVRAALDEEYCVGMWERNFKEQLAWRVADCRTSSRPRPLRAPSWSWASMDGAIELQDRLTSERLYAISSHDGKEIAFDLDPQFR
ncbi:HET-domain-containing protein, partial [Rhizodiscina lignyota]